MNYALRRYRQNRRMTQKQLAADIQISPCVLHNLEYNYGHHVPKRILKFCKEQGLDPTLFYPCD